MLEFNLSLASRDSWTGTIFALQDGSGGAGILSRDRSCVAPAFVVDTEATGGMAVPVARFSPADYQGDGGDSSPARTREGHIKVIAMADLVGSMASAASFATNGMPHDCAALAAATTNADMRAPTTGLRGSAGIIDVRNGVMFGFGASALAGFTSRALFWPATTLPGPQLSDANDADFPGTVTARVIGNDGSVIQASYPQERAIDAVSAVLMVDSVINDFQAAPELAGFTDWVLTAPTKRYYTDPRYTASALPPYTELFDGDSCTRMRAIQSNHEGRTVELPTAYPTFPGQPTPAMPVCSAASIIAILNVSMRPTRSHVLMSANVDHIVPFIGSAGTMRVRFDGPGGFAPSWNGKLRPSVAPHADWVFHGLPVIGFVAGMMSNGNVANGVLANYSGVNVHSSQILCTQNERPCDE